VVKGVLVVEWGQFQYLKLNNKPPENKLLFFIKNPNLKLRNKITQQNVGITNKFNYFLSIVMKKISRKNLVPSIK
jgi:hypothetical protein